MRDLLCFMNAAWKLSIREQVSLDIIEPLERSLERSLLASIDELQRQYPQANLTIVLPEQREQRTRPRLFAHPRIFQLKVAFFFRPQIIMTNVLRNEQSGLPLSRTKPIRHRFLVPIAELDRVSVQSLWLTNAEPKYGFKHRKMNWLGELSCD